MVATHPLITRGGLSPPQTTTPTPPCRLLLSPSYVRWQGVKPGRLPVTLHKQAQHPAIDGALRKLLEPKEVLWWRTFGKHRGRSPCAARSVTMRQADTVISDSHRAHRVPAGEDLAEGVLKGEVMGRTPGERHDSCGCGQERALTAIHDVLLRVTLTPNI